MPAAPIVVVPVALPSVPRARNTLVGALFCVCLALVASFALPVGMVIYSIIAAIETWNGHDYRYPYISRWVERQLIATA